MDSSDNSMSYRVTVYIVSHNYARYLPEALASLESQSVNHWELILIDDASSDDSRLIMQSFADRMPGRVRLFHNDESKGLRYCANLAIREARGRYVIRLDADDYFDENALLILSHYLDQHEDVALVYPNFTYVDQQGRILAVEQRKKLGEEDKLLDLPTHGACTMVRRRILRSIGGYDESHDAQDGTELWLKVKQRYKVGNVPTPLFFYRQHPQSLSRDEQRILDSRQRIKRSLVKAGTGHVRPIVAGIIPVKNTYLKMPNVALQRIAGKPLIDYTIDEALSSGCCDTLLVTTDDQEVVEHCQKYPEVIAYQRPKDLSQDGVGWTDVMKEALVHLERDADIYPDIIALLSVHSPIRKANHIQKAVDSLILTDADSVVSVYEDLSRHYLHGQYGLEAVNQTAFDHLRFEREMFFIDNNAIKVLWRDIASHSEFLGKRISHIVMPRQHSYQIRSNFDLWLVEQILLADGADNGNG